MKKILHSLSTKLAVTMLLPLSLLLLVAMLVESRTAAQAMIDSGEAAAANLANTVKEELQGVLRSTKTGVEALSLGLARRPEISEDEAVDILRQFVTKFPLVYGSTLAFERGAGGEPAALAPYVYRSGDSVKVNSLAGDDYRYWQWDWFTGPLEAGAPQWSAPYFDEGGGEVRMVTYSTPLVIANRRAVLTADIELRFLTEIAGGSLLGRPGAVLVFDAKGRLVAHPRDDWLLERTLTDISSEHRLGTLDLAAGSIARGEQVWYRPEDGMHEGLVGGDPAQPGRLLLIPLKEAGWGIGVYFSDHYFLAGVEEATRFKLVFTLATLILLASALALVSFRSLKPLGELAERTKAISEGRFHGNTPGQTRKDEIGSLSRAFNTMQDKLQHYINDLTQATSERHRFQAEHDTARLIHQTLMPDPRPDFSHLGVELEVLHSSSREVGGDLYNYSMLQGGKLLFTIGDVSQTGVSATLFMSRADALLRVAAKQTADPAKLLEFVNLELCEDNSLRLFVNLLAGMLSLDDGCLELASAGHDAIVRIAADGTLEAIEVERGSPAGLNDQSRYQPSVTHLQRGDAVLAYTSGVTQVKHKARGKFTRKHLLEALEKASDNRPSTLLTAVTTGLADFTGISEFDEELTLLAVRLDGGR